jgi:UDP-N-acetylmuramoyl-tripeptide--D-alanyl-D-alanine ligase
MMHHKQDPSRVNRAYACASVAKAEGIPFYYFTPDEVDIQNETINGFVYEDGRWTRRNLPFPDVVYNTGSPQEFKSYSSTINVLKKRVPFTTMALGNKRRVYERLTKANKYMEYLPETEVIRSPSDPIQFLEKYSRIVIKPADGRKGIGVVFVELTPQGIRVTEAQQSRILSLAQFSQYIKDTLLNKDHLVQPYIKSVTKHGLACDFRLHVQKNGQGEWVFVAAFVRVAPPGTIVCNISSGGYFNYLKAFLIHEYGERYRIIRKKLQHFALGLANHLDEIHAEKFKSRLDELGIDIGIDENEQIWLYEVNWRPGSPPALYLELDVIKNALQYAVYVARTNCKKRQ